MFVCTFSFESLNDFFWSMITTSLCYSSSTLCLIFLITSDCRQAFFFASAFVWPLISLLFLLSLPSNLRHLVLPTPSSYSCFGYSLFILFKDHDLYTQLILWPLSAFLSFSFWIAFVHFHSLLTQNCVCAIIIACFRSACDDLWLLVMARVSLFKRFVFWT